MRLLLIGAVIALCHACSPTGERVCITDREALLSLDYFAFDQNPPRGGWRGVSRRSGCELAAAELIAEYRQIHQATINPAYERFLFWHEGQLMAQIEDYEAAADLFDQARYSETSSEYEQAWNLYVDASIAFVNRNEAALVDAYDAMLILPEPGDWQEYQAEIGGNENWPQNGEIVKQLIGCFDRPYHHAYHTSSCARQVD